MLQTKGTKGLITKFAQVQKQVVLFITGALRSTAKDTLNTHANLLLFHLLVSQVVHRPATRLACLPDSHPLTKIVRKAAARRVMKHRAPLHNIMDAFRLKPDKMEKIAPVVHGPKWKPAYATYIPTNKEQAITVVAADHAEVQVFTDGSWEQWR